jgi:hypothetical protein
MAGRRDRVRDNPVGVNAPNASSLLFPPILDDFGWDRGVNRHSPSAGNDLTTAAGAEDADRREGARNEGRRNEDGDGDGRLAFPIEVGRGGGRLLVYASRPPTEPQSNN